MSELQRLMDKCKCGVFVTVNEHRDYYETAEQTIVDAEGSECPPEIDAAVRQKMIETDTIIICQFYPRTPVSSYAVWHYDLDTCLAQSLACLDPA